MFPSQSTFNSVFQQCFDVVVFGAGLVGFAAAQKLAEQGRDVLLIEPSGDLLWEATRALDNSAQGSDDCPQWRQWLQSLGQNGAWLDVAQLEIKTAHWLKNESNLKTLLYATPVAVTSDGKQISGVTVATKSGFYPLQAHQWVDATENGYLTRLCEGELVARQPQTIYRSLILQSTSPENLDAMVPTLLEVHPQIEWFQSSRVSERRLRWPVQGESWHRQTLDLMSTIRQQTHVDCLLSHCAMREFPVYEAAPSPELIDLPLNLHIGSPAFRGEALSTPAERFALGIRLADSVSQSNGTEFFSPLLTPPTIQKTHAPSEVLVVGTGTAGAVAAIAAARNGVKTVALDFATYPGGVGTGAGINSYFHGASGGLQDELDERTQHISQLLTGGPAGVNRWHHEAKKLAILEMFDEAGVTFIGDALLCGVEMNNEDCVEQALVVIDGQLVHFPALTFIDSSGDGDLCFHAGAPFVTGREGDSRTLSYSQSVFSLGTGQNRLSVHSCNFDAGWVDPTDPEDLSQARLTGIAQHINNDWNSESRPIAVAPLLGLRQSRQICTDIQVEFGDMLAHTRFEDAVGQTKTVADTHSVDFEFESDELAFYYWTCRGFRHHIGCELPYRMMLPRGLNNVWIACRAAGISIDATYGLRMQRDLQRLGEAAGIAAAMAANGNGQSRGIDLPDLQCKLGIEQTRAAAPPVLTTEELLTELDKGIPAIHLWELYQSHSELRIALLERLTNSNLRVSFYSAAVLAMWGDDSAQPRLISALVEREVGPTPEECFVSGAFGQCIALPFWLQSVVLLRRIGTNDCLPALRELAAQPDLPFNALTTIALTSERLALRLGYSLLLVEIIDLLSNRPLDDAVLPPSRSLWGKLYDRPQKQLNNERGADTSQDHSWQLHLVIARTRRQLGLEMLPIVRSYVTDSRAFVRQAFQRLFALK